SSNGYAFMAIVLHWVDNKECLIDFCEIIGDHSGFNMANTVWGTLAKFGLK
ncbi:hypothetical protein BDP27DRAFT_1145441, partial [Rhodocollybia butyracea]